MSKSDSPCHLKKCKDLSLITLTNSVIIQHATEFKTILIEAINEKKNIRIDMSALNKLDVTTIQLLFAAKNEALANNVGIDIFPISESVKEILRSSGVFHEMFSSTSTQSNLK
ncbi:STAS domain-containing protein [Colwellia piezophila]|uniref:STAS domain-containing protein n=1 Tax=Colwellia piezophila TaxID=211668 RepID=UPI00036EBC80|nr:STAS domain-containing protein [Colwellia piezophila]